MTTETARELQMLKMTLQCGVPLRVGVTMKVFGMGRVGMKMKMSEVKIRVLGMKTNMLWMKTKLFEMSMKM